MAEESELFTTKDINEALRTNLTRSRKPVRIAGLEGHDSVAAGIMKTSHVAHVNVEGTAGDFLGAFNGGAIIHLEGDAGRFAGTNMTSGRIIISGKASEGLGSYLGGGTVICKGYAADCAGQGMIDGTVIIEENTGKFTGLLMEGGIIVVLGDTGIRTGCRMRAGTIYVGGKTAGVAPEAQEETMTTEDRRKLKEIFARHDISADPGGFGKVIPREGGYSRYGDNDDPGIQIAEED